ncbi:hypothetical protein H6F51_21260 [Cyanobacteria bacterium FACHB-DQ100]|uniref:hypothetical protein n=1 Tax=Leptolyngbya sp. DQ-M1 TaxID=2933920 RepID=UPI001986C7BE|nr:hypothetical protein [Cyanobacteria bacterium FACHB-DQ100]
MKYQEQLTPWVVYQITPDLQRQVVIRFRRRNDADSYLKVLTQTRPTAQFIVAFDAPPSATPAATGEAALV